MTDDEIEVNDSNVGVEKITNTMTKLEVFVPGRLCILGEHTDWIGGYRKTNRRIGCGYAIVCSTREGVYATCNTFKPMKFRYVFENNCLNNQSADSQFEKGESENYSSKVNSKALEFLINLDIEDLKKSALSGGFFCYVAGTLAVCLEMYAQSDRETSPISAGLEIINYKTTLPMKKGLSSSASVCVLVCSCFNKIFNATNPWSRDKIMDIAYRGECLTGSKCGRMDQCVVMGHGVVGLMKFTNLRRDVDALDEVSPSLQQIYCKTPLHFVVGNVMGTKNTVEILKALNTCFPYPQNSRQSRMHRYAAHNYKHIWNAVKGLELGRPQLLGEAMNDSQSLFDDCAIEMCPAELSSPKLHSLLNNPKLRMLTHGMKGVGSQGDGSIQLLCKGKDEQLEVLQIMRDELQCECFPLTIPSVEYVDCSCDAEIDLPAAVLNTTLRPAASRMVLRTPNHLRCALVVVDGNCVHRSSSGFAYIGNNSIPPSLLPLPYKDGSSSFLMTLLSELVITYGVQRIAVVVSAPFKQWEDEAFAASSHDDEVGTDTSPAPLLGSGKIGFKGSKGSVPGGKSFSTTEAFAASVGTQTLSSHYSAAFTPLEQYELKRDDDPESDENDVYADRIWTAAAEEFDYLRARTRFFFEDPKHAWSPYYTMIQALEMLEASAVKLGDGAVLDVGNPHQNVGCVSNAVGNNDNGQSLAGAGNVGNSNNNMLSHDVEAGNASFVSMTSSSFGILGRMVSSSGNAPILPISNPHTDHSNGNIMHNLHNSSAGANNSEIYKKYVGPLLLCRGESLPLSAAKGNTKLFDGMVTAMNTNWDSHCVWGDKNTLLCRAGKPVIGLIKRATDSAKAVGSWNVATSVSQNSLLYSDLIEKLQPENHVDSKASHFYEFSGQALVPMRSLLKYLKHEEAKYDDDVSKKPDWIKTNKHIVDSIVNGLCGGIGITNSTDSFYYKCYGYEIHSANIYNVRNDAEYREAVLDVVTSM